MIPLPNDEVTPPVTNIYYTFAIRLYLWGTNLAVYSYKTGLLVKFN